MTDAFKFQVKITAVGEVRDAEGNLLGTETTDFIEELTEDDLRAQGLTEDQIREIKEGAYS